SSARWPAGSAASWLSSAWSGSIRRPRLGLTRWPRPFSTSRGWARGRAIWDGWRWPGWSCGFCCGDNMSLADFFRQLSILVGLPAVLVAGAGVAVLVIARDWRLSLFSYAVVSVML